MATRFCGICGTEVDEDAAFCPSCGNPLNLSEERRSDIPAAPAWPEPEPEIEPEPMTAPPSAEPEPNAMRGRIEPIAAPSPAEQAREQEPEPEPEPEHSVREPERYRRADGPDETRAQPAPTVASVPPPGPAEPSSRARRPPAENIDLPFTLPVMLSGWLIAVGSLVAALSLLLDFRTFANPVSLIVFLLLLAVAATVFLSSNIPDFANRRLWVLVVVVAAFGIGLWRVGLGGSFAGVVFFLASLAAAAGAILIELGQDRPMGGPVG